jgi:hypothetical protein
MLHWQGQHQQQTPAQLPSRTQTTTAHDVHAVLFGTSACTTPDDDAQAARLPARQHPNMLHRTSLDVSTKYTTHVTVYFLPPRVLVPSTSTTSGLTL